MSRKASAQTEESKDIEKVDDNLDVEVEVENEPEVEVVQEEEKAPVAAKASEKEEPKESEEVAALKKQLEALTRSESEAKQRAQDFDRQRAEAIEAREKLEVERNRHRFEAESNQLDAINAAISAAKSEAERAEQMLEQGIADADPKRQAEAHRLIARAESNLTRLEDGKDELEHRISLMRAEARKTAEKKEEPKQPEAKQEEQSDPIERMQLPDRAKEWLREHREFAEDPRKNAKLMAAHWDALDEGHKEFSTDYFVSMEKLLGIRKAEEEVEEKIEPVRKEPEQRRSAIVSAPVSREGSSTTGTASKTQVRLTKEEAEFAQMAGITPAEYAKQKLKLQELKKQGVIN